MLLFSPYIFDLVNSIYLPTAINPLHNTAPSTYLGTISINPAKKKKKKQKTNTPPCKTLKHNSPSPRNTAQGKAPYIRGWNGGPRRIPNLAQGNSGRTTAHAYSLFPLYLSEFFV